MSESVSQTALMHIGRSIYKIKQIESIRRLDNESASVLS